MYIANKLLNTELVKDKIFQNSYLAIYRDSFFMDKGIICKRLPVSYFQVIIFLIKLDY